ncbi:uncharacterized protein C8Q71DRAFT_854594 [Rhodofomes roseus]|uniref:Uncharacterized protein n=1 Tax=Rhodofomes roseus TaxID=34475 RepID=A0ABQ8KQ53_9APHY|nr:uncharacterized protein C8Q71DRAFT_854594 [Rhodofomes roseus]KAH9840723.1 hypothetical protein C8Q71DRAFT_854594 [Rhodofomes roseus]
MPNLHVKPITEAYIARYYCLIEVIKAEANIEPCLLPVTRSEWLSWANCVCWMLHALFESYCKAITDNPNTVPSPYSFNDVIKVMIYINEVFQRHKLPHDPVGTLYLTIAWSEESVLHRQALDEPLAPVSYQLNPLALPEYCRLPDTFDRLANTVHRLSEDQQEVRRTLGSLSTSIAGLGGRDRGINFSEPVRDVVGSRGGSRGRGHSTRHYVVWDFC